MSRIDALEVFTAVVRANNFTSAADQLGLTPSAVSKQISALEDRLGVRLLNRTTRSVSPTEAGTLFYERSKRILEDIEEAEELISDLDTSPKGTLKITATSTFGHKELAQVFTGFSRQYPDVNCELFISDHTVDIVHEGFDLALRLGSLEDSRLIARPVASQQTILCAAPIYLQEYGHPQDLQQIEQHRVIIVSDNDYMRPSWLKQFEKDHGHLNLKRAFMVNDVDMAYEATLTGLGVGGLPTYIAQRHIEKGELVHILPELKFPTRKIHVVYHQSRYVSTKIRVFVDYLSSYFSINPNLGQ